MYYLDRGSLILNTESNIFGYQVKFYNYETLYYSIVYHIYYNILIMEKISYI